MRLLSRVLVCSFLLIALIAHAAGAEYKIRSIKFTGSRHYDEEHLIRATGLKIGDAFDKDALAQIAERISAAGVFSSLQYKFGPSGDGIGIRFEVADADAFLPVIFDNFVWWTSEELIAQIQSRQPLFDGAAPEGGAMMTEISVILEDLLRARGVASTVSYRLQAGPAMDTMHAFVVVADNVEFPVSGVKLVGAENVPPESVQTAVEPLIQKPYRASTLQSDLHTRLHPVYGERGYLKMRVGMPLGILEGEAVSVTMPVIEGKQYRTKSVEWSGDTTQAGPEALALLSLKPGEVVNGEQLRKDLKSIHDRYGAKGYIRAEIEPEPVFDDAAATVAYNFRVNAGQQFVMGNFEPLGLDDISSEQLKTLWGIKTGAPFDSTYMERFIREAFPQVKATEGQKLSTAITTRDGNVVDVSMTFEPIPRVRDTGKGNVRREK